MIKGLLILPILLAPITSGNNEKLHGLYYTDDELSLLCKTIDPGHRSVHMRETWDIKVISDNSIYPGKLYLFGSDGYVLVGEDYRLFAYDMSNQLPFVPSETTVFNAWTQAFADEVDNKVYRLAKGGDYSHDPGKISDSELSEYLANYYSGYNLVQSFYLPLRFFDQFSGSVYLRRSPDLSIYYAESNCFMTAGYMVLDYLARSSIYSSTAFSSFPAETPKTIYNPYQFEPATLNHALSLNDPYMLIYDGTHADFREYDPLYVSIRTACLGIDAEAIWNMLSIWNLSQAMEIVCHTYGINSFDAYEDFNYNYLVGTQTFADTFIADRPFIFLTQTGAYGQHFMPISGTKVYKKTEQFLWWTIDYWGTLLQTPTWNNQSEYLDLTRYNPAIGAFLRYDW